MKLNFFKRGRSYTNKIHVIPEQKLEELKVPKETIFDKVTGGINNEYYGVPSLRPESSTVGSFLLERDMTPDEIEAIKREEEFIDLREKIRDLDKFVESINTTVGSSEILKITPPAQYHYISWEVFNDFLKDYYNLIERIEILENLLNIKNKVTRRKKQGIKTIEAVIKVMEENKNELHMNDIFNMIKKFKLKNQNVSLNTVKTTIYNLLKEKRIKRGKKPTCFQICQSSKKT